MMAKTKVHGISDKVMRLSSPRTMFSSLKSQSKFFLLNMAEHGTVRVKCYNNPNEICKI